MKESRPTRGKEPPTLERKIYFFRSSAGKDAAGINIPFEPKPSLTALQKLPFTDDKGRYLVDPDGNALCAWVDHLGADPRMRFAQIRRVGLPQIDAAGNLSDLNLAASEGLVEPAHIVFFPHGLVGIEFNFYGFTADWTTSRKPRSSTCSYASLERSSLTPAAVRITSRPFGGGATPCESQPSKRSQADPSEVSRSGGYAVAQPHQSPGTKTSHAVRSGSGSPTEFTPSTPQSPFARVSCSPSALRACPPSLSVARDLPAPAMAIGSNPLSSTRKSPRAGTISSTRLSR